MNMNELLDKIKARRSVRKYKPQAVPKELIDKVIEAGLWAASGKNQQTSIIVAVTDPQMREKLRRLNCEVGGWKFTPDPFYGAPVVLIVLGNKAYPNHVYDGSLAMSNMMLEASDLGLGSCWINRAKEVFDSPEGKEILKEVGIEGDWEGIGHCILGYPEGEMPQPLKRKENRVYYIK